MLKRIISTFKVIMFPLKNKLNRLKCYNTYTEGASQHSKLYSISILLTRTCKASCMLGYAAVWLAGWLVGWLVIVF